MARLVAQRAPSAKSQSRQKAGKNPPSGGTISPIMLKFREIFPHKTALELALRTGADIKHCEKCLAGTRNPGGEMQQHLLRSDVGNAMLIAIMGEATPQWWAGFQRHLKISELRRLQMAQQRQIEDLERGAL